MQRQLLEPAGRESVTAVVGILGAIPTMNVSGAELAIRTRRAESGPGEAAAALADGLLIQGFAFRGAVHYLTPEDGGAYLALRCAGRQWELPSWQQHYALTASDWPSFRETVREALTDGPLTMGQLGVAVTATPAYRHLRSVFEDGAGTLIKPLSWQGDLGFGPVRGGQPTFHRLDQNPRWAGVWDLEQAGPYAVAAYFRAYGPATPDHVYSWLGGGLSAGRARLRSWLGELGDRLVEIDVEGEPRLILREDVDDLRAARPTQAIRLLPGHDQWVLGPGTKDPHVVPPARRDPVTRKANLVVEGGVVHGTWAVKGAEARITWFGEFGRPPRKALADEVERLSTLLDQPLGMTIAIG